jgi:hypothetical protein
MKFRLVNELWIPGGPKDLEGLIARVPKVSASG